MELMGLFLFTQLYRLNPEESGCAEVCLTSAEDPAPRAKHRSCSAKDSRIRAEESGCAEVCLTSAEDPAPRAEHRSCSAKDRSEEHTSELQSRGHLVCRLLLEKKKKTRSSR